MKTQIVYVLISSEKNLFLEEMWVSLYSLRHFHPEVKVTVFVDKPTENRVRQRKELCEMITNLIAVDFPDEYSDRLRSRSLKTSLRELIEGDYLLIDTDTVITKPLDDIDTIAINNIAMVPELHGPFQKHITYKFICEDIRQIFNADVSDAPYWFNSGCCLVRDTDLSHEFYKKWHKNWEHSALVKGQSSDQRSLLYTDSQYGYIIECLPNEFNCQLAMSMQYFYDAKILHFWHMRDVTFSHSSDYSPFCDKTIYKRIQKRLTIDPKTADIILNCKSSFRTPSMIVGSSEMEFLFSSLYTVLGHAYMERKRMRWFLDKLVTFINLYYRIKKRLGLKGIRSK